MGVSTAEPSWLVERCLSRLSPCKLLLWYFTFTAPIAMVEMMLAYVNTVLCGGR
jgi:hypothetical protein